MFELKIDINVNKKFMNFMKNDLNRDSEIACGILKNDKILTATKSTYKKGVYRMIAGGMEKGETPKQCAIREIYEETGIKTKSPKQVAVIKYRFVHKNQIIDYTTYLFILKTDKTKFIAMDEDENISGYKWFKISDLPKISDTLIKNGFEKYWGIYRAVSHDLLYMILSGRYD